MLFEEFQVIIRLDFYPGNILFGEFKLLGDYFCNLALATHPVAENGGRSTYRRGSPANSIEHPFYCLASSF